jgi:hypothetical protein
MGEIESRHSAEIIIEPTRSQAELNGLYWGNSPNRPIVYVPSKLERIATKLYRGYKKLEERHDKSFAKFLEKERKWEEYQHKSHYLNGHYLSNCQVRAFRADGYTVWDGKLLKTTPKIRKGLY